MTCILLGSVYHNNNEQKQRFVNLKGLNYFYNHLLFFFSFTFLVFKSNSSFFMSIYHENPESLKQSNLHRLKSIVRNKDARQKSMNKKAINEIQSYE